MKRRWMMVFALLLVALLLCACGRQESPVEDFEYEMVDGEVIITGYKGTDQEIYVPAMINERPVTQIGEGAFSKYDLILIDLPDGVRVIGQSAFSQCVCLKSVVLPDTLERIEDSAFFDCNALEEVALPSNLCFLGSSAFGYCDKLRELRIPDEFEGFDIEQRAWYDFSDGGMSYGIREEIMSPVYGGDTVLIVKEQSKAMDLLEEYGYGKIAFVVD